MREILYRVKRKADGKYYFGVPYKLNDKIMFISGYNTVRVDDDFPNSDFPELDYFIEDEICVETIGQYTGLKDKNGKKIFECDIVNYEEDKFIIKYDNNEARYIAVSIFNLGDNFDFSSVWVTDVEIIGNIYDNPELCGGFI